jgi:hypothetical protein
VAQDVPANDTAERPPHERRGEPRSRVLLTGKLYYPQMDWTADCTVRDLSASGARIRVRDEDWASGPYLLVVKRSVVHGLIPVWRLAAHAGVSFAESLSLVGETPPHLRSLQRLWMELRRAEAALTDNLPCGPLN